MKILVGVNGDKDYLPHHRLGAKGYGGDCYPGYNILRSCSEYLLDMSNRHIGEKRADGLVVYQPLCGDCPCLLRNRT